MKRTAFTMLSHVLASSLVIHLVSLSSLIPSSVAQDYSGTGYVISRPPARYYHEDVGDAVYNSKPYISGDDKPETFSHSQDYDDNRPDDDTKVKVVPRHVDLFSLSKGNSYPSAPYSPEYNKEADGSSDSPQYSSDNYGDYKDDSRPSPSYSSEYKNERDISEVSSYSKPDVFGRKKPDISNPQKTSYPSQPYPPEYNKGPDVIKDVPSFIKPLTSRRKKPDTYTRPQENSYPSLSYPRDYDNFPDNSRNVGKFSQPSGKKPDGFRRSQETSESFQPYPPTYDKKEDDSSRHPRHLNNGEDYREQNPSGFKYNKPEYPFSRLVKGAGTIFQDIVKDHIPSLIKPFLNDKRAKRPSGYYEDDEKRYEDDEKEYIQSSADGYRKPAEKENYQQFKKGEYPFSPLELIRNFFPKSKKY